MNCCPHIETFNSLCVMCGKVVPKTDMLDMLDRHPARRTAPGAAPASSCRSILVNGNEVRVSTEVSMSKLLALHKARKLVLVLDIDHTLLHSVQIDGAVPAQAAVQGSEVLHLPVEELVDGAVKHLVMKKRPHLDAFLRGAHEFCEMTLYTAGTRRYAEAVAKALDPDGGFFGRRIITRSDGSAAATVRPDLFRKSLDKAFIEESRLAVILDDREDVWLGEQAAQLLLVRAYRYFFPEFVTASSAPLREVNNAPGASSASPVDLAAACPAIRLHGRPGEVSRLALPTSPEYTESDDQLPRCLEVLRDLQRDYYAALDATAQGQIAQRAAPLAPRIARGPHMKETLSACKRRVLAGFTLTFSGLIPVNTPAPEEHPLWRLAVSLGAKVSLSLLPRTTHTIATQTDTHKVTQCLTQRAHDVWVVHVDWLFFCRWAVAHVDESAFRIAPQEVVPQPKRCFEPLNSDDVRTHGKRRSPDDKNEKDQEHTKRKRPTAGEPESKDEVQEQERGEIAAAGDEDLDDDEDECGVFESQRERPFNRDEAVLREPDWEEEERSVSYYVSDSGSDSEGMPSSLLHPEENAFETIADDDDDDEDEDDLADFESLAAFMQKRRAADTRHESLKDGEKD